jgi:hypothetical protein
MSSMLCGSTTCARCHGTVACGWLTLQCVEANAAEDYFATITDLLNDLSHAA